MRILSRGPLTVALVLLVLCEASAEEVEDFIASNFLPDGEVETRIFYQGVYGKEVAATGSTGVIFRQLANHRHLLQLIYRHQHLEDCEVLHQKSEIKKFLNAFKRDISSLLSTSNLTITSLDHQSLPSGPTAWFNHSQLTLTCRQLHQDTRHQLEHRTNTTTRWRTKRSKQLLFPGTKWCGASNDAARYTDLGVMSETDRCCRRHDRCKLDILPFSTRFNYYNLRPFTISHCHCDARGKRDISDLLRVPGTKWCGKGYSADKYTRLGGFSKTDKCCRRHDLSCPFWIGAFETRYGLFNWRINTIMHCNCDERFRTCLKMADTGDANLVGKLFFNVVQSKCFVIKPKKVCVKSSWWGQCERYKYTKQAILRDNPPY